MSKSDKKMKINQKETKPSLSLLERLMKNYEKMTEAEKRKFDASWKDIADECKSLSTHPSTSESKNLP
jgi:hypothetical protein